MKTIDSRENQLFMSLSILLYKTVYIRVSTVVHIIHAYIYLHSTPFLFASIIFESVSQVLLYFQNFSENTMAFRSTILVSLLACLALVRGKTHRLTILMFSSV